MTPMHRSIALRKLTPEVPDASEAALRPFASRPCVPPPHDSGEKPSSRSWSIQIQEAGNNDILERVVAARVVALAGVQGLAYLRQAFQTVLKSMQLTPTILDARLKLAEFHGLSRACDQAKAKAA
jgi:hypothetical protein